MLAFRDRPRESNERIQQLLRGAKKVQDKNRASRAFWWLGHPQLRAALAEALNHNHVNNPAAFPPGPARGRTRRAGTGIMEDTWAGSAGKAGRRSWRRRC